MFVQKIEDISAAIQWDSAFKKVHFKKMRH